MSIKLEDISKSNGFKVEDKYFEELPLKIQNRISQEKKYFEWGSLNVIWKLGIAILPIIVIISFLIGRPGNDSIEDLLASIPEQDLLAYLESTDLQIEELSDFYFEEDANLEMNALDQIELNDDALEEIYLEYDLNTEI